MEHFLEYIGTLEYRFDLFYLVPLLLIAGVLDGIAGGGGIIALPAYLLTGMPTQSAYACNKIQSCLGTSCSCAKFIKGKYIDFQSVIAATPFAIAASFAATNLVIGIPSNVIKIIICCCMPIPVVLMFVRRKVSSGTVIKHKLTDKNVFLAIIAGAILGAYDGLFGPGGGTIAIILFSMLLKYDLRVGNGNGKFIIVVSNLTATIKYIFSGLMIWHVAIPCALANMAGSYIGASLVIKKGDKLVFPAMITVIVLLIVQTVLGLFGIGFGG